MAHKTRRGLRHAYSKGFRTETGQWSVNRQGQGQVLMGGTVKSSPKASDVTKDTRSSQSSCEGCEYKATAAGDARRQTQAVVGTETRGGKEERIQTAKPTINGTRHTDARGAHP